MMKQQSGPRNGVRDMALLDLIRGSGHIQSKKRGMDGGRV